MSLEIFAGPKTQNLRTPSVIFRELERRFGRGCFHIDVAADAENALCPHYFSAERSALDPNHRWSLEDALLRPGEAGWRLVSSISAFGNPPFGNVHPFVTRAVAARDRYEVEVAVLLVPARVDKSWWHFARKHGRIHEIEGRVAYIDPETNKPLESPFEASAVLVFDQPLRWV